MNDSFIEPEGYVAYSKDESNRRNSTSGGIFWEIARYVITNKGVVYGAAYDERNKVLHVRAENLEGIERMRGSKYVQSEVQGIFEKVQIDLQSERLVLFCGTPCQVAGLKKFLNRNYDKLICIDFFCLGIPSPKIWNEYIDGVDKEIAVKHITFKDKKFGWHNWSMLIQGQKKTIREPGRLNPYMQAYLKHLTVRESCFCCPYRKIKHASDITVADAWGIERFAPNMDDDKGTSAVVLQTKKGKSLFESIDNIVKENVEIKQIVQGNPFAENAIMKNPSRAKFFDYYYSNGLQSALKKYAVNTSEFHRRLKLVRWGIKMRCKKK